MVLVIASAFGAADEEPASRSSTSVTCAEPLRRLRDRRAADALVVAFSAWRVSVMTISTAIRNLPEPPRSTPPAKAGARARRGSRSARCSTVSGAGRRVGDAAHARHLARPHRPRPAPAPGRRVRAARLHDLRPCDRRRDAPALERLGIRVRPDLDGLLDLDRRRPDDRDRRRLGDRLQRRPHPRAVSASSLSRVRAASRRSRGWRSRTRCGPASARARRSRCSRSSSSRSSPGRRRPARSSRRSTNVDQFGGGFQVRAGTSATAPIDEHARRRSGQRAGHRSCATSPRVGSQSVLSVKARQLGAGRPAESYVARGLDQVVPRAHDLRPRRDGARLRIRAARSGMRWRRSRAWRSSTRRSRRAGTTSTSRCCPTSSSPASTSRTASSIRSRSRSATRRPGEQLRLKVIGILKRRRPAGDGRASRARRPRTSTHSRDGSSRRSTTSRSRRESIRRRRRRSSSRRSSRTGCRPSRSRRSSTTRSPANRTFNRLIQGFMGLGLVVGVAALGVISARAVVERRQQIGVLRAIGFRRGMVQAVFLIESSFIALTSIVAGTVLGPDPRREHRPRHREAAELGEPDARRSLGNLRRRSSSSSTSSRSRRRFGPGDARIADPAGRGASIPVGRVVSGT